MNAWTNQSIFDFVSKKLMEQGGPSVVRTDAWGGCAYRGKDGRKCAAGWLIPDSEYSPKMEGRGVRDVSFFVESGFDLKFLEELQDAHDVYLQCDTMEGWKVRMREIAEDYNLDAGVLNATP